MADVPTTFPEWLRWARESYRAPGQKEPWTYKATREAMLKAINWAPFESSLSKYETGKQKAQGDTREKFIRFWSDLGITVPDFDAPPRVDPTYEDRMLAAAETQAKSLSDLVEELRRVREKQDAEIRDLHASVGLLTERLRLVEGRGAKRGSAPRQVKVGSAD